MIAAYEQKGQCTSPSNRAYIYQHMIITFHLSEFVIHLELLKELICSFVKEPLYLFVREGRRAIRTVKTNQLEPT